MTINCQQSGILAQSFMNWTDEQRQAIETRDKSILVSAAAGSGKTAVLIERIKQLIHRDGISIDEILVVTFTNAAASEMREKIVTAIPEQINEIHKSHISTFHTFALEVIRRYFHLIDLEHGFRICDDADRILIQNAAMDQLFSIEFEKGDESFIRLLNRYGSGRNEDAVREMIAGVHNFIQSLPDPFGWLDKNVETLSYTEEQFEESALHEELIKSIHEEASMAVSLLQRVLNIVTESGLESLTNKASIDLNNVAAVAKGFSEDYDLGRSLISGLTFERFAATKAEKEGYALVRDEITMLRDSAKEGMRRIAKRYCTKSLGRYVSEINETYEDMLYLESLVKDFDSYYREGKEKKKVIDFSDIEHYALDILSMPEAADEYKEKFKYIFIDEYQDSNLVQEALIEKIQRGNNVFMVGDIKQSIYKFRLAEPEIFIRKYERFKNGIDDQAIKLDLNRNFRSKGPIIKFVNETFEKIMNVSNSSMDYDENAALYKGVSYEGPLEHEVELHLIDDKAIGDDTDDEIRELKKAEIEALLAAKLIKEAIGTTYYNEKAKQEQRLKKRDIVILLRSSVGVADVYQATFEQEGIPAYMDTGDGYFDTMEVSVFINLLKVIDNRKQDVPLLSVLRSSVFNFSIDDLAKIRSECKEGTYFYAFSRYIDAGNDDSLRLRCSEVMTKLNRWREEARFIPLSDFIWRLIESTGYYNYIGALPAGIQRQANIRALADKALNFERNFGSCLFDFINYIEAIKKRKIAIAPIKLIGESDDVVRIMTIHKSKGLEYPMVLLGGLGRLFHSDTGKDISLHKELGIAMRKVDENLRYYSSTLSQRLIEDKEAREGLAEEIRILYVALTRGMDKLTLLGTVNDAEKSVERSYIKSQEGFTKCRTYLDFLLAGATENKDLKLFIHRKDEIKIAEESELGVTGKKPGIEFGEITKFEKTYKLVNDRLSWIYEYQAALLNKSKYSATELSSQEHAKRPPIGELGVDSKTSLSVERGNVYHKLMEHIPLDKEKYDLENVEEYISDVVNREMLTDEQIALIDNESIARFFNSTLGKRLRNAKKVYREASFNMLKEKEGEEIIVQGVIDCYFFEGDKCVLIDFKSDYINHFGNTKSVLVEKYRPQLQLYKDALKAIRNVEVKEAFLYLFSSSEAVSVELD